MSEFRVTGDSVDPIYNRPYVDTDQDRVNPVPHRYIHGGFRGTGAEFSLYFPPADQYQGRFFHNTYPMATTSDIGPFPIAFDVAIGDLGFTIDSGAYYVQTNLGGADRAPPADPAIAAYRVNAAAAKYSRQLAADIYGAHRPYGYMFGGSGGAYQVMGAAENTSGVWDGFVPFVVGTSNAIPSMFTIRMHALRILRRRDRLPGIADALAPGGSGDPYAALNDEEKQALAEATAFGYPFEGWWNHRHLTSGYFANVAGIVPMLDPTYVADFWTKPGYLGSDPDSDIRSQRRRFDTTVASVVPGLPARLRLHDAPDCDLSDAHLIALDGDAKDRRAATAEIDDHTVTLSYSADPQLVADIKPGDRIRLDNEWALALQTYHRHQVPSEDQYAWNQYRGADGQPVYPQRNILVGPIAAATTAGGVPDGNITGKMLMVQSLMDIDALPWQADWYKSRVKHHLGQHWQERFALWFIDRTSHDNPPKGEARAHTVRLSGALQQALRDIANWVENGARPWDTAYHIDNSQVRVPDDVAQRGGIQPLINLTANGGERTEVRAGDSVAFQAHIQVPAGAGDVVAAQWDFYGRGLFPYASTLDGPAPGVRIAIDHRFDKPGTYFPALKAVSQREGNAHTPYGRVENLARVRVVVK